MSIYFWKGWSRQFKLFNWVLLFLAVLSTVFFFFTYFSDYRLIIDWHSTAYFQQVKILLDQLYIFPFTLDVENDNLVILQRFYASPPEVSLWPNYLILGIAVIFFSIALGISGYLSRIWFLISMGLWIVLLSMARLEMLLLFGQPDYIALLIIGGSSVILNYYFHEFGKNTPISLRVVLFLILFCVLAILIWQFSEVQFPFIFLTSSIVIPLLFISVIFIFLVAHEIVASFIYLLSDSSQGKNNLVHFFVITAIYLINLALLYLHHINFINWNIWYLNPYLLLIISTILGFWGYRQREVQYQTLFPHYPLGSYFFLALMFITYGTLGFFYGTGNDPAFEIFEEAIIYGHLAFGLIFLIYILANFSGPLGRGLKVNKILYKPQRMPYFVFRFAGLVGVFALAIGGNMNVPLYYTYGTFYNQQGNYADLKEEVRLSEAYYQQSRIYAHLNHHANYALANYYNERKEFGKASVSYLNSLEGEPFPQGYINLANLYNQNHRFFDALFTLQEGAKRMDNGKIFNNLALLYSKTDVVDSVFYFLDKSMNYDDSYDEALANIEAFAAVNNLGSYIDSLEVEENPEDIIMLTNKMVRYNKQKRYFGPAPDLLVNSEENDFFGSGLAYNYLINTIYHEDTTGVKAIITLADKFLNTVYNEKLRFGQSSADYYHFYVADAFRRLNNLANESYSDNASYFKTLGFWALEQNAPDQAAKFFSMAGEKGANSVAWLKAFSNLLDNDPQQALEIIHNAKSDTINSFIIKEMASATPGGSDQEKLFYISYHLPYYDTATFNTIVPTIEDNNLRAKAILAFSRKLFDHDLTNESVKIFSQLADLELTQKALFHEMTDFEMKLLTSKGQILNLANYINGNNIEFPFSKFPEKVFYRGVLNAVSGDSISALQSFRWVAENVPFNEMEVIKATDYIKEFSDDPYEVYNLILNALELNPKSVRLLKAYILEATRLGLDEFATNGLEDLQKLIHPDHYSTFLAKLQDYQTREIE